MTDVGGEPRLTRLLAPRSVAMIGGRPAELAIEQCRRLGYEGEMWAVHPTRTDLAGVPCVPSVDDLPGVPDAALVAVNRHATVEAVGRLAAIGAGAAVCYASGFAEIGPDGAALQEALVAAADGMPVLGPNCYGTVSATVGAALWPDQQGCRRTDRGVALVTQSGNIGLDLTLQTRPMPIAHMLTLGNQADVGIEECLEALVGDPAVTAVGLHVEALHDVPRFVAACRLASRRGVPVVALKTGSSTRGAEIAASHTSSMVGSDEAYQALFCRAGVRRVRSVPELLDTLHVLDRLGGLPGNRIVSLSCSGGEASIVADRCEGLDLSLPEFDGARVDRIRTALGDPQKAALVSVSNPFDYHTFIWGDPERLLATFTEAVTREPDGAPDAALLVLDFPPEDPASDLDASSWWPTLEAFGAACMVTGTPGVVAASMAENLPLTVEASAVDVGLVPVRGIDEALVGLEAAAWWGRRVDGPPPASLPARATAPSGRVGGTRVTLPEAEAKVVLAGYGVPVPAGEVVGVEEAAAAADRMGWPVVVKAVGVAHKTEVDGVAVGLTDAAEVTGAARQIGLATGAGRVLVEAQVGGPAGGGPVGWPVELLVTVRRADPVGWPLTVGSGGILVEVLADTRSLLLPATDDDIRGALQALAIRPLLDGHRGRPGVDLDAVVDVIKRIGAAALAVEGLVEVEVNPLMATAEGATVVDVLMQVEVPEEQS
ncbi:MAG: acetate--CoA ligase family protein [Acidimicrobiaceae bacterium]|nr:acetate--CoA ligase family protein [Acidimicrobiaceae bacterium]